MERHLGVIFNSSQNGEIEEKEDENKKERKGKETIVRKNMNHYSHFKRKHINFKRYKLCKTDVVYIGLRRLFPTLVKATRAHLEMRKCTASAF